MKTRLLIAGIALLLLWPAAAFASSDAFLLIPFCDAGIGMEMKSTTKDLGMPLILRPGASFMFVLEDLEPIGIGVSVGAIMTWAMEATDMIFEPYLGLEIPFAFDDELVIECQYRLGTNSSGLSFDVTMQELLRMGIHFNWANKSGSYYIPWFFTIAFTPEMLE